MSAGVGVRTWLATRPQLADVLVWAGLVGAGLALTAIAVAADARVGVGAAPFAGRYHLHVGARSALAPVVAVAVLAAVRSGWVDRLSWRLLLLGGWVVAVVWALALAAVDGAHGLSLAVEPPSGYLADVGAVHGDPAGFLSHFVTSAPGYGVATRTHPPGALLLVAGLHGLGIHDPALLGAVIVCLGALSVPCVAIATRSLCHEAAGRRVVPLVALASWAVWSSVSIETVTAATVAAGVACGVLASERGRNGLWQRAFAVAAGLFLGGAALLGYAAAWLGASVIATYFVRRKPGLIVVTAVAALVPLGLARLAGFTWTDGLSLAQQDFADRVAPHRSWLLWAVLDLALLLIACGPAIVTAARGLSRTPGWPFLVGTGLAVGFAIVSGLSRGGVERSWLPYFPWLLVPAVAPLTRPAESSSPDPPVATPVPWGLLAFGALTAVVIEAVVRANGYG